MGGYFRLEYSSDAKISYIPRRVDRFQDVNQEND